METMRNLMLDTSKLHPHPDNPRKALGDLTELTESIRKNGLMQNLTVIPDNEDLDSFTVLIGHRRLAAAKDAHILEFPCNVVEGLSRSEQIGIMLEENMQRNDLTYLEQAQSFQLMLDLGESVESVAEKTGFSETTVRHRVEIAKLDPELVAERAEHAYYQFSLTDYAKLEAVPDIGEREKILATVSDRRDLEWKIRHALDNIKTKEGAETLKAAMKDAGIKQSRESRWSGKVEVEKEIDLRNDLETDKLTAPEDPKAHYRYIIEGPMAYIVRDKEKSKKLEKTEWELAQEQRNKNRKQVRETQKEWQRQRRSFIKDLVAGHYTPPKKEEAREIQEELWKFYMEKPGWTMISIEQIAKYMIDRDWYEAGKEEQNSRLTQAKHMKPLYQMLILADKSLDVRTGTDAECLMEYEGTLRKDLAEATMSLYKILERLGFQTDREVYDVLSGRSDLFEEAKHEETD